MALCLVVFPRANQTDHEEIIEADSLYAAADKALRKVHRFWWYDPSKPFTVKQGEREWQLTPDEVRRWRERMKGG
jgi:hypothetical protein